MMIDHLLAFDSEADALAFLPAPFVVEGGFNLSCVFPGLTLFTQVDQYDEEGNLVAPRQLFDNRFWVLVSINDWMPDQTLITLPQHIMAADREAAAKGEESIFPGLSLNADPQDIASIVRVDGLPAGSAYSMQNLRVMTYFDE